MTGDDRIGLYTSLIETFLARAREKGYIIIGVPDDGAAFVQYQIHGDRVYGEVGSRQWLDPERPLPAAAVAGLDLLGFRGGGVERNFAADGLPRSAAELAMVADRALRVAYGLPEDYAPVVRELNLNDVTLPRAEPFTRAMIEAHLRDHGATFLVDQDGDFRVDLACDGNEEPVTIWLIAEGPGDGLLRISGMAPHRPAPSSRGAALEMCNAWNSANRTPTALVAGDEDSWRLVVATGLDLTVGITRQLFDAFTERAVSGILAFWSQLASSDAPEPSITDDREQA